MSYGGDARPLFVTCGKCMPTLLGSPGRLVGAVWTQLSLGPGRIRIAAIILHTGSRAAAVSVQPGLFGFVVCAGE